MAARLTLPDGKVFVAIVDMHPRNPELGWFGSSTVRKGRRKAKKFAKKAFKGVQKGAQFAHKVTHKGPIGKAHMAVQKAVGKALPFTKPFINLHNKVASPVHKIIEGKKIRKAVTAKAIVAAASQFPKAQQATVVKALVAKANQADDLRDTAKIAALAKVARKAKKGKVEARKGFYVVLTPSGRRVEIPKSKVA